MKIKESGGYRVFKVFNAIILTLISVAMLYPFLYLVAQSFSSTQAIVAGEVGLIPKDFNISTYKYVITDGKFIPYYGNTVVYSIIGTVCALLFSALLAYPLSKAELYGGKAINKFIIFTMYFGGGMIPNYLLVSSLHLTGTRWAMLLPFCISQFNLIIMINSFKSLPHELEEAALIDGLGYWGILRRIIVPLSTAAIATVGLYYAVFFWNDWFNSLIYLNNEQYPDMVGDGAGSADKSSLGIAIKSAVIIVSTLPIIILYPFLQKYFVKGLTVGGVKG